MPANLPNQATKRPRQTVAAELPDRIGLPALLTFTSALTNSADIDDILTTVTISSLATLGAQSSSVWFFDRPMGKLTRMAKRGAIRPKTLRVTTHPVLRTLRRQDRPTLIGPHDRDAASLRKIFGADNLLIVPIIVNRKPLGLLVLTRPASDPWLADQTALAAVIGQQSALAIANATRVSQLAHSNTVLEEHHRKLQKLYQLLERLTDVETEEELLKRIPELACDALEYNYAVLERLEGRSLRLLHYAVRQPASSQVETLLASQYPGVVTPRGLVKDAFALSQPVAVHDPASDPRVRRRFAKEYFSTMAVFPVMVSDRPIGTVLVANHIGGRPLQTADLELLSVFSKICAYALAGARFTIQQQHLVEIASIRGTTLKEYTDKIVNYLPAVVAAKAAVIALPDASGTLRPVAATKSSLLSRPYQHWLKQLKRRHYAARYAGPHPRLPKRLPRLRQSLTTPILYDREVLGLVHIFRPVTGNFSPENLGTAKVVATRIGYVIKILDLVKSLRNERQQFSSIVHGSADGILSIDKDDQIQFFNPAMEKLTGWREEEVIGQTCAATFNPRGTDGGRFDFTVLRRATRRRGRTPVRDASLKTKSGQRRWVGITAAPLGENEYSHTIVVIRDITEQREMQQRQREFVSIASHELRTPITALLGYLSLMEDATDNQKRTRQFTRRAQKAAIRLSELVEDLLNVARMEDGRLPLRLKPLRPGVILDDVIAHLRPSAERKRITFSHTSALRRTDLVRADRGKLTRVFANLLDNAIKYTASGGRIAVSVRPLKKVIRIRITDNGIGIHPKNLERIFEKFFREYTELSVPAGGTGLGLFITKELVERQGGRLSITSAQNEGTTATVELPRYVSRSRLASQTSRPSS